MKNVVERTFLPLPRPTQTPTERRSTTKKTKEHYVKNVVERTFLPHPTPPKPQPKEGQQPRKPRTLCEERNRKNVIAPPQAHPNPNRKKVNNQENQEHYVKNVVERTLLPHPRPTQTPKSATKSVGRVPTAQTLAGRFFGSLGCCIYFKYPLVN